MLIIGCGGLLYNALLAARELGRRKDRRGRFELPYHKADRRKKIVELAKKIGAVVTVEEHQVQGGLGGAVAEVLAKYAPTPIEFIGMQNTFGESGAPEELIKKYGMMPKDIIDGGKARDAEEKVDRVLYKYMKQKYDVVCIGDVVMDAFIALKEAKVEWDKTHEHPRACDGVRGQDPVRVAHGGARGGERVERGGRRGAAWA